MQKSLSLKILKYISNLSKSRLHNERKIIFLSNIDLIGNTNQKILSNIIEKNSLNSAFIFTANTSNIIKKLNSMSCIILFPYLDSTTFINLFNKYYKYSDNTIPYFWMPKYSNAKDASARSLNIYKEKNTNTIHLFHFYVYSSYRQHLHIFY